jgi:Fe2+ transport system protein B
LFVVFYVPCIATIAVIARELGWRDAAWISGLTAAAAIAIGLISRLTLGWMA